MAHPENPIVLFDGVCTLCNWAVDFMIRRDKRRRFRFASLQGSTAKALGGLMGPPARSVSKTSGLRPEALVSMVLFEGGVVYTKSDAALRVLAGLGGLWRLAGILQWVPRVFRDAAYDLIARNRYRWFGKLETCRLPTPGERERFLP